MAVCCKPAPLSNALLILLLRCCASTSAESDVSFERDASLNITLLEEEHADGVCLFQQKLALNRLKNLSPRRSMPEPKLKSDSARSFNGCLNRYADELDKIGVPSEIRAHPGTVISNSSRSVVFGVGQGTTATHSVAAALIELGLTTAHYNVAPPSYCKWFVDFYAHIQQPLQDQPGTCSAAFNDFDYTTLPDDVDAFVDSPIPQIFLDLYLSFPNAKWLLSTRPSQEWAESRIANHGGDAVPVQEPCEVPSGKSVGAETLSRAFDLHNELVRCVVPQENLFELDVWNSTDGVMQNLADFLAVEISDPNMAFPDGMDEEMVELTGNCSDSWILTANIFKKVKEPLKEVGLAASGAPSDASD